MDRRAFFHLAAPPPPVASNPSRRAATNVPKEHALCPLAIPAGLDPSAAVLDRRHAAHLLRRLTFGAAPDQIDALTGLPADEAVDLLVDGALAEPLPEPPAWIDEAPPGRDAGQDIREQYQQLNREWLLEVNATWFFRLCTSGLRERLTLFWHNHFVTELETYRLAVYAYRYVNTLRTHALGNFKTFVHAAGLDPAMLIYLNGVQNQAAAPNENYARELLELFTMGPLDSQGQPNYTQQDIEEIARALTGWTVDRSLEATFVPNQHDDSEKTIFGQTGPWGYDDVVDLIFTERAHQTATFICRKLYQAFVYAAPDEDLVAELADVFVAGDFEIAPVLRVLFKSAHFHDDQVIGAQIKSPVHLLAGMLREAQHPVGDLPAEFFFQMSRATDRMEQALLSPPNVAGWTEHHAWLNTTTLPFRWIITQALLFADRQRGGPTLAALSETLLQAAGTDPSKTESVFPLAAALAEHFLPVPLDTLDINEPEEDFAGDLLGNPLPETFTTAPPHQQHLAKIFLAGVPWYEWDLNKPEAQALLLNYLRYLSQLPEFQLT